ncbi:unnamed protein product [Schistosoma intercalatum]|nr:unnamed protein product [Schistosoma intercalatum]CAH8595450.1 unnamed protein product [Schistosoma intercalatum]
MLLNFSYHLNKLLYVMAVLSSSTPMFKYYNSKRFRISITFKMEKNSQGKNNPITKNETVADISNSSVDDNSLISRATKAVRDYLEYDFECLVSDVNILTRMNQASSERYMELTTNTNDMTRKLIDVNNRFASLSDALKKIDQFDKDIEQLEKKAFEIETLTKQLENRYNKLETERNH